MKKSTEHTAGVFSVSHIIVLRQYHDSPDGTPGIKKNYKSAGKILEKTKITYIFKSTGYDAFLKFYRL